MGLLNKIELLKDMIQTAIDNGALKTTCSALDNQGRQLRDWLRDRDNDCRNRLISEATALVSYTTRLGHPEA